MSASLERFTAQSLPDSICEAVERDGAAIIEGLLPLLPVLPFVALVERLRDRLAGVRHRTG